MVIGKTLGRYRIVDEIATGGMGEVYRAIDELDGREVAVKLLRTDAAADPIVRSMFAAEASVALTLRHRNIVQALDTGRALGRDFFVMELVSGVDLGAVLRVYRETLRRPLPLPLATRIVIEALRGLEHAHRCRDGAGESLRLVHRDVSPENVLVSFDGEVKLADFGVAQSALKGRSSLVGALKGKVVYMAPEQLRAEPIDARADIYSMGVVLYEMITGRRPFSRDDWSVIPDIIAANYPRPREINADIPAQLEDIVLRELSLDAADRDPSAAAMALSLEALAWELGWTYAGGDLGELAREASELVDQSTERYSPTPTRPARPGSIRPPAG